MEILKNWFLSTARIEMGECRRQITREYVATLVCALVVLFVTAGCVSTGGRNDPWILGLEYRVQQLKDPRPNRVHILRADLATGRMEPAVVLAADPDEDGPAEATLTDPLKLASDRSVIAFVNTNPWGNLPDATGRTDQGWFEGQPVDILGLAVAGGRLRSRAAPGYASVWVGKEGRVVLGNAPRGKPVVEGMAGFQQIVREGVIVVPPGGPLHPRTAVGADRTGKIMWLVVVDGRQEQYSEGMTIHELDGIMGNLGCWNATNMDGGGSSVMGLTGADGQLRVVNSPSDRRSGVPAVRPVPSILTIRQTSRSSLPAATNEPSMER